MRVNDFEEQIWLTEGIRIIIRAPLDAEVDEIPNSIEATPDTWTIDKWVENRIQPYIKDFEVVLISGDSKTYQKEQSYHQ